jgi:predicted nucleic acid-binding protein
VRTGTLLDTGPLVAYLYRGDTHHDWAVETLGQLDQPAITCEAVLTEACFLVARNGQSAARVLDLVSASSMRIDLQLDKELSAVAALMRRYANVPMSLADACLVRMAEMTGLPICTLDADFRIYRARGHRGLDLITPPAPRFLHEP